MKSNCWEVKKCGRQPGGENAGAQGVCPVAVRFAAHGINGGINGGRCCWAIVGNSSGGEVNGAYASKRGNCMQCDFYLQVRREEKTDFVTTSKILQKLAA